MNLPAVPAAVALAIILSLGGALAADEGGWVRMFNGKDLSGWKPNEETPGSFTVEDGAIKVCNGPAHLFYVGEDGRAAFKNFELKAKVMTTPGSNSGIYFHTEYQPGGWPAKGFEAQVNTSHSDDKKSGGLYAVKDVLNVAPSRDNEWFDYTIKVEGRRIVLQVNGKTTADWTQPADWDPSVSLKDMPGRKLGEGTIALQGHDPKSTVFYKDIFIRPLP